LLALALGLMVWVAGGLRRPEAPASPQPSSEVGPQQAVPRLDTIRYAKLTEDEESFVLEAASWVGDEREGVRLAGVEATFSYKADGEVDGARISSEECLYDPAQQKAQFEGDVELRTESGFVLRTDSLTYSGERALARSEDRTAFSRGHLSGTSLGLVYDARIGEVTMPAEVFVRIEKPGQAATEIRSGRAELARHQGTLMFLDGVELTQGSDRITAGKLRLDLAPDRSVTRARFRLGVSLTTRGATPFGGSTTLPGGGGERRLDSRMLDVAFREGGSLESVVAWPEGDLTILPGPGDPPERRHLQGHPLGFRFDEAAQLTEVHGLGGSLLEIEALPPARGPTKTMRCGTFRAHLDPATGTAETIDFEWGVSFTSGARKASGERASFVAADEELVLRQEARLVDEELGSELTAGRIHLHTGSGDISAHHNVRHVHHAGGELGFLGAAGAPAVVISRLFEYRTEARAVVYRGKALLRSGKDELRAEEIRIRRKGQDQPRLTATGDVLLRKYPTEAEVSTAAEVEGHAQELRYDDAAGEIVLAGEVSIRQGDIMTRSPEATLSLAPEGGAVAKLVAGHPVEVRQGERIATGDFGTYTPSTQTMVLVGEKVTLDDPTQRLQGRSLTFRVGDERIQIDGGEQVRTRMILRTVPAQQ